MVEYNDIYDASRRLTGRLHRRGTSWAKGDYGLVVCVWVHDGEGNLLLTRRAPQKSYPGTWENSGGMAKAGETSRQAIARELWEETGIQAPEEAFEWIGSDQDSNTFYDFYCLKDKTPLDEIRLLPGETDDARWVTIHQAEQMVASCQICQVIGRQFLRQKQELLKRQSAQ